jgi:hypothetical protein
MKKALFIFLLLSSGLSYAQPLFQNIYKKSAGGYSSVRAFDATPDGSYYALVADGSSLASVIKIASDGSILWDKIYSDTAGQAYLNTIVSMPDGGFAAGGTCNLGFLLIRCDSWGNVLWSRTYHYFFNGQGITTMAITPDKGFIFSGNYYHNSQPFIARVDSLGNAIFFKKLVEYFNFTLIYLIKPSSDGNYFALFSSGDYPRARVMKFDIDGNELWSVGVGDSAATAVVLATSALCATPDGGCMIGGTVYGGPYTHQAMAFCKINSLAGVDWIRIVPSSTATYHGAYSVTPTHDQGYMVGSGLYDTTGTLLREFRMTKTDSLGHFLWTKIFSNIPSVRDIKEKADHGFTVASSVYIPQSQMIIFSTDSLGNALCDDSPFGLVDSTITLPLFTPVYVVTADTMTQDTISLTADSGMVVIDYCQLVGVPAVRKETSITIFPNPFYTSAKINAEFTIHNVQLNIYNTLGVLVRIDHLVNHNYILHREFLSQGMYFFQLQRDDGELVGSGKFVIQ